MRLRLKLVFERQAEILAAYPWEFIFMPLLDKGFFLSGEKTELILTRFVGVADNNLDLRPDEQPLRILVASANPSEASFDIAPFRERLEGSIGQLEQVELKWREQPRYESLIAEIESYKPHIFHFVGHGEAGRLALIRPDDEIARDEAETGRRRDAHWVDFNTFSEMFAEHKPRLVFLHACKGAATVKTTLNVFTSMARELAYSNIPAVVGMQYEIADTDAATFARSANESSRAGGQSMRPCRLDGANWGGSRARALGETVASARRWSTSRRAFRSSSMPGWRTVTRPSPRRLRPLRLACIAAHPPRPPASGAALDSSHRRITSARSVDSG